MPAPKIAIVILNYNGKKFLEQFLPGVILHSAGAHVYVADNASTDDSVIYLKDQFKQVHVIQNDGNYGYAKGYNLALSKINADIFVLLNSDVEVSNGWLEPIVDLMVKDQNIGACQPKLLDYHKREYFEYAGASGGFIDKYCYPFCRGRLFNHLEKDQGQYNNTKEIFWATGACLFVKAETYKEAGGLDDDYFAHMEEIDLCWRMRNLGYRNYVVPTSVVYHVGGGTLNKQSSRKTFLNFRNNLITLLKNDASTFIFFKIFFRLVLDGIAGLKFMLSGDISHTFAVLRAHFAFYYHIPSTLKKRKKEQSKTRFKASNSQIYNGNIVAEHYLRGKKNFSDLNKGFLSE